MFQARAEVKLTHLPFLMSKGVRFGMVRLVLMVEETITPAQTVVALDILQHDVGVKTFKAAAARLLTDTVTRLRSPRKLRWAVRKLMIASLLLMIIALA